MTKADENGNSTAEREQQLILDYIREQWRVHNRPTFREIGNACNIPLATAYKRVNALIAQGKVRKGSRLSRSLEPTA